MVTLKALQRFTKEAYYPSTLKDQEIGLEPILTQDSIKKLLEAVEKSLDDGKYSIIRSTSVELLNNIIDRIQNIQGEQKEAFAQLLTPIAATVQIAVLSERDSDTRLLLTEAQKKFSLLLSGSTTTSSKVLSPWE